MKDIRLLRNVSEMTQNELAEKSGVSRATIARIETSDKKPSIDTALKLAAALNCTVEQLVGIEPFQPKEPKDE